MIVCLELIEYLKIRMTHLRRQRRVHCLVSDLRQSNMRVTGQMGFRYHHRHRSSAHIQEHSHSHIRRTRNERNADVPA